MHSSGPPTRDLPVLTPTAGSMCEAEYIAASEVANEGVWMKEFISDLGVVGERSRNSKFSTHNQDQSMERLATRERGVHLHTLEDRDAEALQERG